MESCRIPIEVCEAIMDALAYWDTAWRDEQTNPPLAIFWLQHTLCACALTCRAWRVRAQLLLWNSPYPKNGPRLVLFIAAIRTAPNPLITSRLGLHNSTLASSAELFMHAFPNLRRLVCAEVRFDHGPPLSIFRMRLPFFASITSLQLVRCRFGSWRAMLDVVWAFPNLASLRVRLSHMDITLPAVGRHVDLSAIRGHLRACQKLIKIHLTLLQFDKASQALLRCRSRLLTSSRACTEYSASSFIHWCGVWECRYRV